MATAIEYGLIAALIAIVIITAVHEPETDVSLNDLAQIAQGAAGQPTGQTSTYGPLEPPSSNFKYGAVLKANQGSSWRFIGNNYLGVLGIVYDSDSFASSFTYKRDSASMGPASKTLIDATGNDLVGWKVILTPNVGNFDQDRITLTWYENEVPLSIYTNVDGNEAHTVFICGHKELGVFMFIDGVWRSMAGGVPVPTNYESYGGSINKTTIGAPSDTHPQFNPNENFTFQGDMYGVQIFSGLDEEIFEEIFGPGPLSHQDLQELVTVLNTTPFSILNVDNGNGGGGEGEGGGGGSTGDPYITPVYGPEYKLPNKDAVYRLFENKDVYINANVSKATEEKKQSILNYYKKHYGEDIPPQVDIITDGFYYDRFFIASGDAQCIISVDNGKINGFMNPQGEQVFQVSEEIVKTDSDDVFKCMKGSRYKQMNITWTHEELGRMSVGIQLYKNPQHDNGIILDAAIDRSCMGLLVCNYKPKLMELPSVETLSYKKLQKRVNKSTKKYITKTLPHQMRNGPNKD